MNYNAFTFLQRMYEEWARCKVWSKVLYVSRYSTGGLISSYFGVFVESKISYSHIESKRKTSTKTFIFKSTLQVYTDLRVQVDFENLKGMNVKESSFLLNSI